MRLARPSLPVVSLCLAAGLAACSSPPPTTFDLTAPRDVRPASRGGQLAIAEPVAVQVLDSERIIVKDSAGAVSFVGDGQWADRLPRLFQARLLQTFENARRIGGVSRPGDRIVADYQLNTEIRAFQIMAGTGEAFVEVSARLVNDRVGRVVASRIFSARVPGSASDAAAAARALDQAMSQVLVQIVGWTR